GRVLGHPGRSGGASVPGPASPWRRSPGGRWVRSTRWRRWKAPRAAARWMRSLAHAEGDRGEGGVVRGGLILSIVLAVILLRVLTHQPAQGPQGVAICIPVCRSLTVPPWRPPIVPAGLAA